MKRKKTQVMKHCIDNEDSNMVAYIEFELSVSLFYTTDNKFYTS